MSWWPALTDQMRAFLAPPFPSALADARLRHVDVRVAQRAQPGEGSRCPTAGRRQACPSTWENDPPIRKGREDLVNDLARMKPSS